MEKVGSHRKDEVRTQFKTRDGLYRLMTLSEYSRPSRYPQSAPNTVLLRLSFASVVDSINNRVNDVISFNTGKELYSYFYNGPRKVLLQYITL
jgi:WD repeat-containing protein 20